MQDNSINLASMPAPRARSPRDFSRGTPMNARMDQHLPADAADEQLIALWLHGRSPHTARAYQRDARRLRAFVRDKPLRALTLRNLQAFADSLAGKPGTRGRVLAAVNPCSPSPLNSARYASTSAPHSNSPPDATAWPIAFSRNQMSRACSRPPTAPITPSCASPTPAAFASPNSCVCAGPISPTPQMIRSTSPSTERAAKRARCAFPPRRATSCGRYAPARAVNGYVFAGRRGALHPSQAWRIVRSAAKRAGIEKAVSPHFLRHAHASHALERGVKLTTLRDTLGHSSIAITDRYAHARPEESSGLALAV